MHDLFSEKGVLKKGQEIDEDLKKIWNFVKVEETIRKDN